MTNYNDGNWHEWSGGCCPVHPESIVSVRFLNAKAHTGSTDAATWDWMHYGGEDYDIVAFRVIKEHREPREWWISLSDGQASLCDSHDAATFMAGYVRVREVLD